MLTSLFSVLLDRCFVIPTAADRGLGDSRKIRGGLGPFATAAQGSATGRGERVDLCRFSMQLRVHCRSFFLMLRLCRYA